MTRVILGVLAGAVAIAPITLAASFVPAVPPACHTPAHARTTVHECAAGQ